MITIFIPLVVAVFLSSYVYRQYNFTSNYSKAYDKLITQIIETKKNKKIKILYVDALPDSGMLLPLEIGTNYIDDALKVILDFKFDTIFVINKINL